MSIKKTERKDIHHWEKWVFQSFLKFLAAIVLVDGLKTFSYYLTYVPYWMAIMCRFYFTIFKCSLLIFVLFAVKLRNSFVGFIKESQEILHVDSLILFWMNEWIFNRYIIHGKCKNSSIGLLINSYESTIFIHGIMFYHIFFATAAFYGDFCYRTCAVSLYKRAKCYLTQLKCLYETKIGHFDINCIAFHGIGHWKW